MTRLESIARALLLVLVAVLPFELQTSGREPSVLQMLFVALSLISAPLVVRNWRKLFADRLVIAALAFVGVFWLSAAFAEAFRINAVLGATRVTCGFVLLCIALSISNIKGMDKVLCWSAVAAAMYGLFDYYSPEFSYMFRAREFYAGGLHRLSGSFEYPTTAATFYAMSLPFVWAQAPAASLVVWLALVLTFSRGAPAALFAVLVAATFFSRSRRWMNLAAAGFGLYALAILFNGGVIGRLQPAPHAIPQSMNALYQLEFNQIRHAPGSVGHMPVVIQNIGSSRWENVVLSSHWYDLDKRRLISTDMVNPLPPVVEPDQRVSIDAVFRTPDAPGAYLLDWDLKSGDRWFSVANGVTPGIVEAKIEAGAEEWRGIGDTSRWYGPGGAPSLDSSVSRVDLWRAALQLFGSHPVAGVGPDNFRLRYGQVLGYPRWDSNIRANNLYLELLAGSGILALAAFAVMMASLRWSVQPAALSLGVFLVHGLVDTFLMTTSIYFAFWLLLGRVHADRV